MLLPGTDPVTMLIEMVPLLILFEFRWSWRAWSARRQSRRPPRRSPSRPRARPARLADVLFDLHGKRKRVVQVVYVTLAILFLVGFVGFSIGSDVPGGLFDAFGVGGSGGTGASLSDQYDDQIESASEQPRKDPKDPAALLKLSKFEFYKAKAGHNPGRDHGTSSPSARTPTPSSAMSADAWENYLKLNKIEPSAAIATQMVQAYSTSATPKGRPMHSGSWPRTNPTRAATDELAYFLYLAGDISGGDQAAEQGRRRDADRPSGARSGRSWTRSARRP